MFLQANNFPYFCICLIYKQQHEQTIHPFNALYQRRIHR